MVGGSTYKVVKDKLVADYNYHFETLRGILSHDVSEINIIQVEELLVILSSLKMKISILDMASENVRNPKQTLLFD